MIPDESTGVPVEIDADVHRVPACQRREVPSLHVERGGELRDVAARSARTLVINPPRRAVADALVRHAEDTTTVMRALVALGVEPATAAAHARLAVDALRAVGRLT